MTISSIHREEKISNAGKPYNMLVLKCNGKDKELKIFDRYFITKDWQVGTKIDLVAEERSFTDDYGEKRTSTSFKIAEKIDYLEERVAKLEFNILGGANAAAQALEGPIATQSTVKNASTAGAVKQEAGTNIDDLPF